LEAGAAPVVETRVEVRGGETGGNEARGTVKDLVCGMDIDPDGAAAKEEYQDETYHFCSTACHDKFKAEPEKYIP
jgi:Cu+-exporting ATPase